MTHRRIPTWLLERVLLDEVPPELADEVRAALDESPEERARLAELERSNAEILAALPPAVVAAEVARRAEAARGFSWLMAWSGARRPRGHLGRRAFALSSSLAVAGAVLVAVAVGRQVGSPDQPSTGAGAGRRPSGAEGTTRVKGPALDPKLSLHRRLGEKSEELADGALAFAGDRIQIAYQPADRTHGVILSIDGRGVVNLHFPAREDGSTRLERGGKFLLGHSYELDDAPAFERFVFVTSDRPIDVAAVRARAEGLARDPLRRSSGGLPGLAAGERQSWFTLRKGGAP
ncbi:MAG TPA: hypothetical protein VKB80_06250 [Kofleriaceae bacterium]|nr:hypothetical protein [Kofleriaceae bacterium]